MTDSLPEALAGCARSPNTSGQAGAYPRPAQRRSAVHRSLPASTQACHAACEARENAPRQALVCRARSSPADHVLAARIPKRKHPGPLSRAVAMPSTPRLGSRGSRRYRLVRATLSGKVTMFVRTTTEPRPPRVGQDVRERAGPAVAG